MFSGWKAQNLQWNIIFNVFRQIFICFLFVRPRHSVSFLCSIENFLSLGCMLSGSKWSIKLSPKFFFFRQILADKTKFSWCSSWAHGWLVWGKCWARVQRISLSWKYFQICRGESYTTGVKLLWVKPNWVAFEMLHLPFLDAIACKLVCLVKIASFRL